MIFRWELNSVQASHDGFQTHPGGLCNWDGRDLWALNNSETVAYQPSPLTKIKLAQDIEGSV